MALLHRYARHIQSGTSPHETSSFFTVSIYVQRATLEHEFYPKFLDRPHKPPEIVNATAPHTHDALTSSHLLVSSPGGFGVEPTCQFRVTQQPEVSLKIV